MKRHGVAMLGCGMIGRTHAAMLKALTELGLADVSLVVACDAHAERAERARAEFGFVCCTTDPREALATPGVDVAYVCTPTSSHAAQVAGAADRGLAVFCEKPMAHTATEAEAMARTVARAGIPSQVGLVLRYSAVFNVVRELLAGQSPLLDPGRPISVVFRDDQQLPVDGPYESRWRGDVRVAGGGTLIEHSIHDLDMLRWLLGDVREVWARTTASAAFEGIEDVATLGLVFESGVPASLASIWHQVPTRNSERSLEIFCERAWIHAVGDFAGPVRFQGGDGRLVTLRASAVSRRYRRSSGFPVKASPLYDNGYFVENLAFIRALDRGVVPWPSLDDAVAAHAIVDAAYSSAREGRVVTL